MSHLCLQIYFTFFQPTRTGNDKVDYPPWYCGFIKIIADRTFQQHFQSGKEYLAKVSEFSFVEAILAFVLLQIYDLMRWMPTVVRWLTRYFCAKRKPRLLLLNWSSSRGSIAAIQYFVLCRNRTKAKYSSQEEKCDKCKRNKYK